MNNDLKNILSTGKGDIDEQKLMDYLNNELSKTENHEVEKTMADDQFLDDAVEGLQNIETKKNLQAYVEQLNHDLQKHTAKNKTRKKKRRLKDQPYTYLTVIIILVLMVIGFIVIKRYIDARRTLYLLNTSQAEKNIYN